MPLHAPAGYSCPFCLIAAGGENEHNHRSDLVWTDGATTAFVSPKWWEKNPGHVIVVPNDHFENLYEIPEPALAAVYATSKRIATALKSAYGCEATSTRQHNEPGAGQEVWHFHVHVFPRYAGDDLYRNDAFTRWPEAGERAPYAERLRRSLDRS
jgi:histidine triad (HIT) family protein